MTSCNYFLYDSIIVVYTERENRRAQCKTKNGAGTDAFEMQF